MPLLFISDFQLNAVLLAYTSDNAARIAGCKATGRNIACYNAACADNAAVADRYTAAYGDISGKPAIASDVDRLCVLQIICAAVRSCANIALLTEKECIGVSKLQFGPKTHCRQS